MGRSPHGEGRPDRVLPAFLAAPTRFFVKADDPPGLGQSLGSLLVQIIARRGLTAAVAIGTPPDAVPQVSQCAGLEGAALSNHRAQEGVLAA